MRHFFCISVCQVNLLNGPKSVSRAHWWAQFGVSAWGPTSVRICCCTVSVWMPDCLNLYLLLMRHFFCVSVCQVNLLNGPKSVSRARWWAQFGVSAWGPTLVRICCCTVSVWMPDCLNLYLLLMRHFFCVSVCQVNLLNGPKSVSRARWWAQFGVSAWGPTLVRIRVAPCLSECLIAWICISS